MTSLILQQSPIDVFNNRINVAARPLVLQACEGCTVRRCTNNSVTGSTLNIIKLGSVSISVRAHSTIAHKMNLWRNEALSRLTLYSLVADYEGFA